MSKKVQPLIYIIDPSQSYRELIHRLLNNKGFYNIHEFDDGESCYVADNTICAEIIILDYNLGEFNWNGQEFMEEYHNRFKNTRFIFLASNSGIELAVDSVKKGAIDYIVKSKPGIERMLNHIEDYYSQIKRGQNNKARVKC